MQANRMEHVPDLRAQAGSALPLLGRRVFIVEDEAIVAIDLEMTLQAAGANTVGPCLRLRDAMAVSRREDIDAAVLDVRLGREESFVLADDLSARGVAIVFHSGHADTRRLRERYPAAGHCPKPCSPATIVRSLVEAMGR